jgi:transposase
MSKSQVFVGIDVAQATLEVAVRPTGEAWQVANDEIAFGDFVERLRQLKPLLVVLEATGGIHLPVVAALAAAKLPVVAVNPRQARDFAKATGMLAKTDRIDARSWPILPRRFVRKCGPCRMLRRRSWQSGSLVAAS